MKLTSQIRSSTWRTPTNCPAKTVLRLTLRFLKQMRPQVVTVAAQSLSTYFQKPSTGPGILGQWGHYTATVFNISCLTPPSAPIP